MAQPEARYHASKEANRKAARASRKAVYQRSYGADLHAGTHLPRQAEVNERLCEAGPVRSITGRWSATVYS
jgi:hypothetical protein